MWGPQLVLWDSHRTSRKCVCRPGPLLACYFLYVPGIDDIITWPTNWHQQLTNKPLATAFLWAVLSRASLPEASGSSLDVLYHCWQSSEDTLPSAGGTLFNPCCIVCVCVVVSLDTPPPPPTPQPFPLHVTLDIIQ